MCEIVQTKVHVWKGEELPSASIAAKVSMLPSRPVWVMVQKNPVAMPFCEIPESLNRLGR